MDLRQLEYVVAVAEELNFTRAAERCHIVQSGLSFQVAKLERELGTAVFDRTSRSVRLTAAGERLLPRARKVLADVDSIRLEIADMVGEVRGVLRLGAMVNHSSVNLPAVLADFHDRYPDVDVVVSDAGSMAMVDQLCAGDVDAAFLGLYPEQLPPSLHAIVLRVEPLVAVVEAANPCAGRDRVDLAELAQTSGFIECRADSGVRSQVDRAFARARTTRHISFELGNIGEVARLASLGLGAAIVPLSVAAALGPGPVPGPGSGDGADPGGGFAVLRLTDTQAQQAVSLVFRPLGECSVPARLFIESYRGSVDVVDLAHS